jgi:hypothetical protein
MPKTVKPTRNPWSPTEVKSLKTLAKGNTPTRLIAMKLRRTTNSVYAKARAEKISLAPPNRSPYG